jgi:hypothetical protein
MFRAVLNCPNQIEKSQQIAADAQRIWVAQVAEIRHAQAEATPPFGRLWPGHDAKRPASQPEAQVMQRPG